jgi:hypothetical protein
VIVLRWSVDGNGQEVRSSKGRVVLGSGPQADLRLRDAGWAPREAVLRHAGTEIHLTRPGHKERVVVRVGDVVHLGRATVALVGLLPREATAPAPSRPPAPAPRFGAYDEEVDIAATGAAAGFTLAPLAAPPSGPVPAAGSNAAPLPHPHERDFSESLYEAARKVPFVGLSIALHAVVLAALWFVATYSTSPKKAPTNWGIEASIAAPAEKQGEEETADPAPALPEAIPELPEPADLMAPNDPAQAPKEEKPAPTLDALEVPEERPIVIGVQPSISSARARTARRLPPRPAFDVAAPFGKSDAGRATDRAANAVRDAIRQGTGGKGNALETLQQPDILVVDGAFDRMGVVLDALRLPYLMVSPYAVVQPNSPSFSQHKVIFWNCGEALPKRQQAIAAKKLKEFVESGGYLFTTDWCVENLLSIAFPGYLSTNGRHALLPETVIDVAPDPDERDNPLLDGVFLPGVQGQWWLEQSSFDISVLRPKDVKVLIRSHRLQDEYHREGPVAVTFTAGRGRVLHVVGHYYQESGNLAGTMAAQRLALNFVLQRLRQSE